MAADDVQINMKMALNAEITSQGHTEDMLNRDLYVPVEEQQPAKAKSKTVANTAKTEWSVGTGEDGTATFVDLWPDHLPRPPSRKRLTEEEELALGKNVNAPRAIVFNANTKEGGSMVRVLSERGMKVVAIVRVFTSKNTKKLTKLRGVTVKIADLNNFDAVKEAANGCQQAFLVTKYWERFENHIEETMAKTVLEASASVGIKRLILATFEDTQELRAMNRKSQLKPTPDGRIFPDFDSMDSINQMAKNLGIGMTHMFTSFLDDADSKKSLIVIRGENNKIVCQPFIQETRKKEAKPQ